MGTDVIANDFILCSGAPVSDGSILSRCFVGQATVLAKHYSTENDSFIFELRDRLARKKKNAAELIEKLQNLDSV